MLMLPPLAAKGKQNKTKRSVLWPSAVLRSSPSGLTWGAGLGPGWGVYGRPPIAVSHVDVSLPLSLFLKILNAEI